MRPTNAFALTLLATFSTALAFTPIVHRNSRFVPTSYSRCRVGSTLNESSTTSGGSPFDTYELGQSTLAYRDDAVGEGDPIVEGDVVTCSFVGRLYPSGYQFAKNEDFVFQIGEGKTMPGFDAALLGTKAGCKRTIRVPPTLAFGTRGNAPKIPPNADLEFDVEVKSVARGAIAGNLAKVGVGRLAGLIVCFLILAVTPFLN